VTRPGQPEPHPALREGWNSACRLYQHLAAGGSLRPLPLDAVRLGHDEQRFGDAVLGYARYYGTQATYQQTSGLWFGSPAFVLAGLAAESVANSAARRRAETLAATQWRDHAHVRTILTDQRLLCDYQGSWLSFWHVGVVELAVDVARWAFIVRYEQGDPLMLHGPAALWFALATARVVYGPRGYELPAFAPLAYATQLAQRTLTGEVIRQPPDEVNGPPQP
jgi:hypothetical protein